MQPTTPPTLPSSSSSGSAVPEGFVRVEGGSTEQVSEIGALMLAYSAIWLILTAFTFATWRSLRSLRAHAARVDRAVRALHTPR